MDYSSIRFFRSLKSFIALKSDQIMSPTAAPDLFPLGTTEMQDILVHFLQIFLLGLFVCGIVGIVWAIFEKANDPKYTVPRMISTMFFNICLIVASAYCSNYFLETSIFEVF
jgi:hypothetical protein